MSLIKYKFCHHTEDVSSDFILYYQIRTITFCFEEPNVFSLANYRTTANREKVKDSIKLWKRHGKRSIKKGTYDI